MWASIEHHIKKIGLDVMQSHTLCRTRVGLDQASSAALEWPTDGDCYLMHKLILLHLNLLGNYQRVCFNKMSGSLKSLTWIYHEVTRPSLLGVESETEFVSQRTSCSRRCRASSSCILRSSSICWKWNFFLSSSCLRFASAASVRCQSKDGNV